MSMPEQKRGGSRQDYQTPPELINAVKRRFKIEEFAIDLAADHTNCQAAKHYSPDDNSFEQIWNSGDGYAWLNPPYNHIEPWVKKAYVSRMVCRTLMLVPASVGSNWYRDWVNRKVTTIFLNGRITFVDCYDPYPKDCMLLNYAGLIYDTDVWPWWQ